MLIDRTVAAETCDESSDIDLLNYYEHLPDRTAFDALLAELGARVTRELSPAGAADFVAGYDV